MRRRQKHDARDPFKAALDELHPGDPKPMHLQRASVMHSHAVLFAEAATEADCERDELLALAASVSFGDNAVALAQEWCVHD